MRWFFGSGSALDIAYAGRSLDILIGGGTAVVPVTWGLEVANVVSRSEATGIVTASKAPEFLGLIDQLRIEVDGETSDRALGEILDIARRYKLTAYDASYLELALRKDIPLATLDKDLRKAAKKTGVQILT